MRKKQTEEYAQGKKQIEKYALVGVVAVIACLVVWNIICNRSFLESSASSLLSALIVVIVSYYLVQRRNDNGRQKEVCVKVLASLQGIAAREDSYIVTAETTTSSLTSRTRDIRNLLGVLKKYESRFGITEDVKFITEKFEEYNDPISDHINDIGYLVKSSEELHRPLRLIESRAYEAMLHLYD